MLPAGRIIAWLLAGLVVGGTARVLVGEGKGGIVDAILGLIGGLAGGAGYTLMMGGYAIPWVSVLTAACGAIVLVGMRDNHASPPV